MDQSQIKEVKLKTRTLLVTFVSALEIEDISALVGSDIKREKFFDSIVSAVKSHFPTAEESLIRRTIDSVIGNMTQCADDLGSSLPADVDSGKLEHWTNQWRLEKSKSKRARNIDVQDVYSHKVRLQMVAPSGAGVSTDVPVSADREHLRRTRYMSQCTMGVYLIGDAIQRGKRLGKGAYGTVSLCHIEGVTWLPQELQYVVKDFHGDTVNQRHNFSAEASVQLFHRGIVRCIAQTTEEPWSLVFPYFNGMDLGDMLECVPPPQGSFSKILVAQGEAARRPPTSEEMEMCKGMLEHAPSFMHALVQAMTHSHSKGIIHCDLHPWNIMTDFTKEGLPRVGIIDWGLALRVGIEQRKTNIASITEHNKRPWRAPELCNPKATCPYTKASDVYAVAYCCEALCIWCKEFSEFYNVPWRNRRQVDCGMIRTLMQKSVLRVQQKARKTLNQLDQDLDMMELNPEHCLRPVIEMGPRF